MSIFGLNCRGLGDPRAIDELRIVLWRYSPKLVFLVETKKTAAGMAVIKNQLGTLMDCTSIVEEDLEDWLYYGKNQSTLL